MRPLLFAAVVLTASIASAQSPYTTWRIQQNQSYYAAGYYGYGYQPGYYALPYYGRGYTDWNTVYALEDIAYSVRELSFQREMERVRRRRR